MDDNKKEIDIDSLCTQWDYDLTRFFAQDWERGLVNVSKGIKSRKSFEEYVLTKIQTMIASWDGVTTETCMAIGEQLSKEDREVFDSFVFKSVAKMTFATYAKGLLLAHSALAELVDLELVQRFKNLVEGQHQLWKHQLRRQVYKALRVSFGKAIANKEVPSKISIAGSSSEELEVIGKKLGVYFTEFLLGKGWSAAFLDNYYKMENVGEFIIHVGSDLGVFCGHGGAPDTLK